MAALRMKGAESDGIEVDDATVTSKSWRRLLLAVCAFGVIQLGYMVVTDLGRYAAVPGLICCGLPGPTAEEETTATPLVHRLTFESSNPLTQLGIRSGDLIDLRALSPAQRYRFSVRWWWLGEKGTLPVVRGATVRTVVMQPLRYDFPFEWWAATIGQAWVLLFAGIVSWRRPDLRATRVLAMCLMLWEIGLEFQSQNWITPFPSLDAILNGLNGFLYYTGVALLATYTTLFSGAAFLLRRVAVTLSYATGLAAALQSLLTATGAWTGRWDFIGGWLTATLPATLVAVLPGIFALICVALTIATCAPSERARVTWAAVPLALLFGVLGTLNGFLGNLTASPVRWYEYIANYTIFLAPLGLAYALLNRRLVDIGFAINRAVVYSGVSIVVVGLFVLFEWALSQWFGTENHAEFAPQRRGRAASRTIDSRNSPTRRSNARHHLLP